MERVAIYLRKSRQDIEAEAHGEGETLAKHKRALLQVAKEKNLNIIKIYEEIVSGESILHRPEMLELLKEIEAGSYDAVLCMDLDRLGRGGMREQGIILEAFQQSKTKIITPRKTYDLSDEFDEEYSEFETFMARRELKLITRRLQRGRIASVEQGRYLPPRPPYGYDIAKIDGHRTLIPNEEQAPVVKLIFSRYINDNLGCAKIANELNKMGLLSYTGIPWSQAAVQNVIKNAVYSGVIQWQKKECKKSKEPGKRKDTRTRPQDEWIEVEGKHEALVSKEDFQKAQKILETRTHPPYFINGALSNPLAGLIVCDKCGMMMVRRPYAKQKPHMICQNRMCNNKGSKFELVEQRLLTVLEEWLSTYKAQWGRRNKKPTPSTDAVKLREAAKESLARELAELEKQKEKLHDFLERGIYDEETYLERSQSLAERIEDAKVGIETAKASLLAEIKRSKAQLDIIPTVEHVLKVYPLTSDIQKKNTLLKSVVERAVYLKEKHQVGDDFELDILPKLD